MASIAELNSTVAFGVLGVFLGATYKVLPLANRYIDERFPEPLLYKHMYRKPPSLNEILRLSGLCVFAFLIFLLGAITIQRILVEGVASGGWALFSVGIAIVVARGSSRLVNGKVDV